MPVELKLAEVQQVVLRVAHNGPCAVRVEHYVVGNRESLTIGGFNILFVGGVGGRKHDAAEELE